jgi:hypothetical protein
MATSSETRWQQFVQEVAAEGYVWTIEKSGEFVTSKNRFNTHCFPWWSSRERALSQLKNVSAYKGYIQSGYTWDVFLAEWAPYLKQSKLLLGINYQGKENVGFDLPVDEVVYAVNHAKLSLI